MEKQLTMIENPNQKEGSNQHKTYHSPELIKHGTLVDITQEGQYTGTDEMLGASKAG